MKKAVIIFSGYNQRSLVAFLRTLVKNGVRYGIIASSDNDPILDTVYKSNVFAVRKKKALDRADLLNCINLVKDKIGAEGYVVAPSTEALNRYLLDNRSVFEDNGCEIPLVDKDLYETVSDKAKFSELCNSSGILIPGEYRDIEDAEIPFVAKPIRYVSSNGDIFTPFLIHSKKDLASFLDQCNPEDFYYQEYVEGHCLYLLYYIYGNGDIVKLSQDNKVQQPGGKSMVAAMASDFHDSSESLKYEEMLKKIGFRGLIMIEAKRNNEGSYMIEANPRFWGPSQFFINAGVNLFEDFLFDNGLINTKPVHGDIDMKARYFWSGGVNSTPNKYDGLVYYDYTSKEFQDDYNSWKKFDIYNEKDTKPILKQEEL